MCLDIDDPARIETCLGNRRSEKIGTCQTPQDLAVRSGGDARHEQARCRTIHRSGAASGDLVQRAKRQASTWKPGVDGRQTERQEFSDLPTADLDRCNACPQRCHVRFGHRAHLQITDNVPILFHFESRVENRSRH